VDKTSLSLLDRVRVRQDTDAWDRLLNLYTPLIRRALGRDPLLRADLDDLCADVIATVVRELPHFQWRRTGSFRTWLRTIAVNRVNQWWRSRRGRPSAEGGDDAQLMLSQVADPAAGLSRLWDEEHDRFVARRLMELIEPDFEASTWAMFRRVVLDGLTAAETADELGTTVNAVLIAKSRVMKRLRDEARGLID
jgi:RNA polymerase sigma-70 factor (ECF subfamily)